MKEILHYSIVLMIIAGIAGGGLYIVNDKTKAPIAAAQKKALQEGQKIAFPNAASFSDVQTITQDGVTFDYYTVYDAQKNICGYEVVYAVQGYQSQIRTLTGVTPDGKITGIKVLHQAETPGLGAEVDAVPTSQTLWSMLAGVFTGKKASEDTAIAAPPFQAQFTGKKVADITVVKHETATQIESISGATITSKAVAKSVREPVKALLDYLAQNKGKEAQTDVK